MVMEGVPEDMGEGSMICTNHPHKNNTAGGICAFCLQEKLGKLVSSFPIAVFPSSSSSSSPSFRSDFGSAGSASALPHFSNLPPPNTHHVHQFSQYYSKRSRILYLLNQKKKKKNDPNGSDRNGGIVFKRSKSTATPRRGLHFIDSDRGEDFSPSKRGFWSFLYSRHSSAKKPLGDITSSTVGLGSFSQHRSGEKREEFVVVEENESPDQASSDRKVSRSRSVGCGSRSFSGDFFERISTGFGDCTLRRVESHREGKSRVAAVHGGNDCMREKVKCGGLFGGFMINSSSSSSSSYWVSSSSEDNANGRMASTPAPAQMVHGRTKSWGWAFASPMRAFSKPSSSSTGKREISSKNNGGGPNLAAIPSLLAVGS